MPEEEAGPVRGAPALHVPPSCTVSWINLAGAASLVASTLIVSRLGLSATTVILVTLAVPALTIVILENLFVSSRIPFRPTLPSGYVATATGASPTRRVILKIIGLMASIAVLAVIYWALPIYRDGGAKDLRDLAERLLVPFLVLMPLYVWYVDRKSEAPEDGYFHAGLFLTGGWKRADRGMLRQHCLQWLVKAFFLPLMLGIYAGQMAWLSKNPVDAVVAPLLAQPNADSWMKVHAFLFSYLFIIDVGVACIGYLLTLKLLDSEIRSTEPTLLGWVVCVICYAPFWALLSQNYLKFGGNRWEAWLVDTPSIKVFWSLLILLCTAIFVWATIQFGIRFSNLTHRGVITNGPYRWVKHPAYVSKNVGFWLVSLPLLATDGAGEGVRLSLMLVGVNFIYFLRARTEEKHLMVDPIYRQYARFMRENDLFAVVRRGLGRHVLPFARTARK